MWLTKLSGQCVIYKPGGFADDMNVICRDDQVSVQRIFLQYERLTRRSGLTMNTNKTEILALHTENILEYENENLKNIILGRLRICVTWYCKNIEDE